MQRLLGFILLSLLFPETNPQAQSINQSSWLVGCWTYNNGFSYEEWKQISPHKFSGRVYRLVNGDTNVLETISWEEREGQALYIAKVANQNNGEGTVFTCDTLSKLYFSVVNPNHDFPQRISYNFLPPDSIKAIISGTNEGRYQEREFLMVRK